MKKLLIILLLLFVGGCHESQKQWGQGELPTGWQESFGNDNLARLNFMQSQIIDRQQAVIFGVDQRDPNGQTKHTAGLIERVRALESENPAELAERVRKLETIDPNNVDNKLGKLERNTLEIKALKNRLMELVDDNNSNRDSFIKAVEALAVNSLLEDKGKIETEYIPDSNLLYIHYADPCLPRTADNKPIEWYDWKDFGYDRTVDVGFRPDGVIVWRLKE